MILSFLRKQESILMSKAAQPNTTKNLVIIALSLWFGFVTFAQNFHGLERFLLLNEWRLPSLPIALLFSSLVGSGYASVLLALVHTPVPRKQTITYCLMIGLAVFLSVAIFSLAAPHQLMTTYIAVDQILRQRWNITIAGMDYGNSQMLTVTTFFWTLVTIVIALAWVRASRSTRKKV